MAMAKKLLIVAAGIILLAGTAGGTLFALGILPPHATHAKARKPPPPKPLLFASLSGIVVSIPPDSGQPASAFVQFGVQFATQNDKAVTDFTALQPIIKAQIISLLMTQTGKSLADPATRAMLVKNCVGIANTVLTHNAGYTGAGPFSAAYITNLVVQN
jgi:flagellar basal body-associated protein FliL